MKLTQAEIDALFAQQGEIEQGAAPADPEPPAPPVAVPASFPRLEEERVEPVLPDPPAPDGPSSLGIYASLEMDVTVRLGQTQRSIGELINLGAGAVLELDRVAGETVDILVNGRLLAKGEVVVIGENFGVRVAELVQQSPGKSS